MLIPRARHEVLKLVMSSQQSQNQKLFICHHKNDKEHQQMLTFKNQGTSRSLTVSAWKLLALIFFLWPAAHKHTVYPVVSKRYYQTAQTHLFCFIYFTLFVTFCDVYLYVNQGGSVCPTQRPAGSVHAPQFWESNAGKSNQLRTQPKRLICELCFYFHIKCGRSVYSFGMRV